MKLHATLVEKLLKIMEINSGWKEEKKLRSALTGLDITVYTQQSTGKEVLVDTEQLNKLLRGNDAV